MAENEHENDWDLWAIVRSCNKRNNSVVGDHSVHEDPPTHGNCVINTQDTTLFQEKSDYVGAFTDSFSMENKRYFGLDEVISLAKNLNTNSRNEPHNQETIPNTPLVIQEEKNKRARYSEGSSRTRSGKALQSVQAYEVTVQELNEADQWRWKKYGTSPTGTEYYRCNEVEYCPARRQVVQSSTDPNKVIATYTGIHYHIPPNQENITETIPNTPLVIGEHEEKNKRARYSEGRSSSTGSGKALQNVKTHEVSVEKLNEADQWRWKKYGTSETGKEYYRCDEVEYCPARRQVVQSLIDPNKVFVTYTGIHYHLPPNQKYKTKTIRNIPLVIIEDEEEEEKKKKNKRARYSEGRSSSTGSGKALLSVETYEGSPEELNEADQWRWKKHKCQTGQNNYKCNQVENCPAKKQVVQSSFDPKKVIVTYIGKHNHPPPNQQTASPNAAAPVEDPSFPSTL